jgi:predicted transcriptional regulator
VSERKISVGDEIKAQSSQRFIDAWHRAEQGETFHERHLVFESWDALARLLTGQRVELLRYIRRHPASSASEVAKALGRKSDDIHADVEALAAAGLLDASGDSLRADYEAIDTTVVI